MHDRLRALLTYLPRNPNRPRLPSWAVFDEAARRAAAALTGQVLCTDGGLVMR